MGEQEKVLIQSWEAACHATEGGVSSLRKELEWHPSLALCLTLVDLAEVTTMFPRTQKTPRLATQTSCDEQAMQHGDLKIHLSTRETCLQQLKKALLSEQDAQAKVTEREHQAQELQDAITELHQEMSRKDQESLRQLQQLQLLENRVKDLTDQASGEPNVSHSVLHPEATRGIDELKVELSRRDETIQRLRRDVLLSHQARDSQSAQLDLQEQRISRLQTERQETQLELQRTECCVQQLQKRLQQSQSQQAPDLHAQVERLAVEVSSLQSAAQVDHRHEELEAQLAQSRAQATECQERARVAKSKTEELHAELSIVKAQHSCLIQQLQDREAELRRTQSSLSELAGRERDTATHNATLQGQLKRATEELQSATCREKAYGQREEHLCELQVELDRLEALLESERQEMQKQGEEWAARAERAEEGLGEESRRGVAASEALRLKEAELEELQGARDEALGHLRLQEDGSRRLADHNRALQCIVGELQDRLSQREEALEAVREKLQHQEEDQRLLRQQLSFSQDALQLAATELRSCKREWEKQLNQEEAVVSRLRGELQEVKEEKERLASQSQGQSQELVQLTDKHRTMQHQVAIRDETVLRLTVELRTAQEQLKSLQEQLSELLVAREEVLTLQKEVKNLQSRQSETEDALQAERQRSSQLQLEKDSILSQASQNERHARSQEAELSRLKASLREAESRAADTEARLQPLSKSLELLTSKYQTCLSKLAQQDSTLQDLKEARAQAAEREERLHAQVGALRAEAKARAEQLESGDEALGSLDRRLGDTQRQLDSSRERGHERELVIGTLRESNARLEQRAEEQEESLVKMQADFSLYKTSHVRSNSDYNAQRCLIQELQQAVSKSREQCAQGHQELSTLQEEVHQLREEVSGLVQLRDSGVAEVLRLQDVRDRLQAEALLEAQRRRQETAALQHKVSTLEKDLEDAQRQSAHGEEAVQKRDRLLRRSEADLCEAREAVRGRAADAECWASAARGLQAEARRGAKAGQRREAQCGSLRAQLLQRTQELEEAQARCTDTGQELAVLEERALLMEAGQQRAQQQLAEQGAEVVRTAQAHRRLQAELQRLQDRLHTAEHELQDYRTQAEHVGKEADESRRVQLSLQQEASRHQQEAMQLRGELTQARDELKASQQQLEEQAGARRALQQELAEEQVRQQEQHVRMLSWKDREVQREADRERLQSKLNSADIQLKEQERTISSLQEHVTELQSAIQRTQKEQAAGWVELQQSKSELESQEAQSQKHVHELAARSHEAAVLRGQLSRLQQRSARLAEEGAGLEERNATLNAELAALQATGRQSQEEVHLCQDRLAELSAQLAQTERQCREQKAELAARENEAVEMKIDMASLRESYHAKVAQVEALHYQLESTEQNYSLAANEVEALRQSLGSARSDSSRLHRESELVVSNVNQLVQEQKQVNTKLTLKMREQNKSIIHLTAEKDHLQESVEGLQIELKRLKAELYEKRIVMERFQASEASVYDQCGAFARSPHHLLNTESSLLDGQGGSPRKRMVLAASLPQQCFFTSAK